MANRTWGLLLASASLLALTAPALADTASIETVVVTASKRAEAIKDVPMAVTAISGDELSKLHATNFADFIDHVPGMTFVASDPGHTQLILRGVNAGGVGSTVGTYLDETPYGSSSALANGVITTPNLDTFDIQRVEVLRGPQGTLYGASTLGGLLKFVTNAPDPTGFAAAAELGGNAVDQGGTGWDAKAMVNVPLSDNAAIRATGYVTRDAGFIDDPVLAEKNVNDVKSQGGRVSMLWELSKVFSIRATALFQDMKSDASFSQDMVPDPVTGGLTFKPLFGPLEQGRLADEYSAVRYRLYNATADYDLGWAALTSATSYGTFNDHLLGDDTNIFGLFVPQMLGQKKFTEEARLASPTGRAFEWLAGIYYTNESAELRQNLTVTPDSPPIAFVQLDSRYVETAGFVNATYHFSPAFDLSVGGRLSHDSQSAFEFGLASANGASDENVFTWSVAPLWHVTDNVTAYARIAKGWRPGGPNALPPKTKGVPPTYGADSLIDYELGVKSAFLDGRLSLDADVFHIDWSNIQLLTVIDNFGVNGNGGTAQSDGFEWNANWIPVDNLNLALSGAYTDARLTSDTGPLVGGVKGAGLPYSPKWSTFFDADYTFASIGAFKPFVGLSWQYIGERESGYDPSHGGQRMLPSYSTIDLRAGVDYDRWSLALYGKNLGDERGITDVGATGSFAAAQAAGVPFQHTVPTAAFIQPRTVGLTLTGKL